MKSKKKCIVMLSGGLDSRLAVKIMQEQGFEIIALFFKLPFGTGCCDENCSFNFAQMQGVELKIFDCTKQKAEPLVNSSKHDQIKENLLQEYLDCLKKPKYGRGAGINPCIDCRIFMFKKAKEFADKKEIDLIVTGEVLGERPMSQMKKSIDIVEEKSGLKGRLLRPLSAKLLPETDAEKKGLVDREKLYSIEGRKREKQIQLAEKFKINYPSPAGGCLLCEKALKNRFKTLIDRGINDVEIHLIGIGRHFIINNVWVVLGRDENENKILEIVGKKIGELIIPEFIGPSALIVDKADNEVKCIVNKLIMAYSKKGNLKDRKYFDKWRL